MRTTVGHLLQPAAVFNPITAAGTLIDDYSPLKASEREKRHEGQNSLRPKLL